MKRFIAVFSVFTLCAVWLAGVDISDSYGSIADYLDSVYGIDTNAGLTAFPVLNVPMGGRSEGMAQAFTAVADDISFIEYNPAGSAMLARTETAFFHNNWVADTKVEGAVFASRIGNLGLSGGGKWLYTPFTEYNIYGERVSKGFYSEAVAMFNASYNFLAGYYFSGVSVGINLKGAFRMVPDFADDDDRVIAGSGSSQSAIMGMADIGALTRFDLFKFYKSKERNTSAALVLRNLGPPALEDPLPSVLCAAISYKPIKPLMISFDFSLPFNMADIRLSEKPYYALGAALNITNFISMRTGVMIKAGSTKLTVGSTIAMEKITLDINYSLDLLTQLQPMNRISLGVRFDMGDQGRAVLAERINNLYLSGLEDYSRGNYADARSKWEEALRLNPRFDPAKESLNTLSGLEKIERRIDSLQRLDF